MGNSTAKVRLANELKELLNTQRTGIKTKTATEFVEVIAQACPWFLTGGFLNNNDWDLVWQQLRRAVLSGGDFLLWKSENQERCRELAQVNQDAGFPRRNLEMLTGSGQYAVINQQINYDPGGLCSDSLSCGPCLEGSTCF